MKRDYLLPGIVAISLAIIFPVYWVLMFNSRLEQVANWAGLIESKLDIYSWLFLLIGAISIYLYAYFKKILHDQLNFNAIDALLTLMIINSAIFFTGVFIADVLSYYGLAQSWTTAGVHIFSVICMVIFGILDIVIGIVLLANNKQIPTYLVILAAISILLGLFEISVIFSIASIIIFPIYLLFLATVFLRKPETIEVV
ncbi:hypothetical protein GCM10009123_15330 [Kangiella japonica]|uniref:DUF4386 domain-containing protein n=1 Tax=Kangiella japonica TaxID=647384 RepID=A0ABP3CKS7_9GAMM